MKIVIFAIGQVNENVLNHLQKMLPNFIPQTESYVLKDVIPLPIEAYNAQRKQYYSSFLLSWMRQHLKNISEDKILGVAAVDLYVPQLNFVFGEAELSGKAALISLYRLRPEFYGNSANQRLFLERVVKEAVHEIGHTLGLTHCPNTSCVMFFSNSITDTDRKQQFFCKECFKIVNSRISKR